MHKTHILVISQYFYPEEFRINDICKEWIKRGYAVTVVTGIPNYPEGRFFDGYGLRKRRKERFCGIRILRMPIIPRGSSAVTLIFNYLSFVFSAGIWAMTTETQADYVFIFEVSPMTQALPGVWFAGRKGIPCYLYMQDLWPDNVETVTGIHTKLILRPINRMVHYIYKKCARIFVTSESFRKELAKRGAPERKLVYWPQYAEDFYMPQKRSRAADKEVFTIAFTGNIGYAQGLEILPETAELLKKESVRFLLAGEGRYRRKLEEQIQKRGVSSKFIFTGRVPPEKIPQYLASADAAFVSFMPDPIFEKTIPAKLQSYMACEMPILAAATGETRRIIEEAQCGLCSGLGDAQGLAENILKMKLGGTDEMRKNAGSYSKKHFNKTILLKQIDAYFEREKDV